jgi:uncharacterized membrane protein (UPF0127 family)
MTRLSLLLVLGIFLACGNGSPEGGATAGSAAPPAGESGPAAAEKTASAPTVTVGQASFTVELAVTQAQWSQGLSRRPTMAAGTGMLFVFEQESHQAFWMKDMRFPLDLVWIDAQCTVVDISSDVPPPEPGQPLNDLPTYAPSAPVVYVLEINAGEARAAGLRRGDHLGFAGTLAGRFGC